jgi:hypothetical protein
VLSVFIIIILLEQDNLFADELSIRQIFTIRRISMQIDEMFQPELYFASTSGLMILDGNRHIYVGNRECAARSGEKT